MTSTGPNLLEVRDQFFNLIPTLSVRQNVALPFLIAGKGPNPQGAARVDQLLEEVGMSQRSGHLPFHLSGGEMQLVSIARALVHRPHLCPDCATIPESPLWC